MTVDRPHVTAVFVEAAASFADLVAEAVTSPLERPALGEWTLRDLVGHASRAFTTVVDYLTDSPPADMAPALAPDGTDLSTDDDPVGACGAYFLATTGRPELSRDVAERGRQAGRSLGGDPAGAVAELAGAGCRLLESAPAGAVFATRFGRIGYRTYVLSRITEVVVHGLDIATAVAVDWRPPARAERLVLAVMAESARRSGHGPVVIRGLGGRAPVPPELSVFG